jgi:hypothetical protein
VNPVSERVNVPSLVTTAKGSAMAEYVQFGAVKTWYDEHGSGDPLAGRFHVSTPERRGHGYTPDKSRPITYGLMADDTIAFLEAVVGEAADPAGAGAAGRKPARQRSGPPGLPRPVVRDQRLSSAISSKRGRRSAMDEADPRAKLEPFEALIGEWAIELTHPTVENTVVRGRASFEWLEGGRFLIQRAVNEHQDFPDSLSVIGVMEGDNDLSMQYFDSRGVHRVYAIGFDGRELTLDRDAPGFAQRGSAVLSDDGSTLAGLWQLNEDDQGYRDDLAFTYRRPSSRDGRRRA